MSYDKPPMNSALNNRSSVRGGFLTSLLAAILLVLSLSLAACGGKLVKETIAETKATPAPPPASVPMWLGNTSRNFYGTGPWPDRPSEVIWEFETKLTSGRLHKDGWGGSSWPGQPSVVGENAFISVRPTVIFIASILETAA